MPTAFQRRCLDCHRLVAGASRCPEHARLHRQQRNHGSQHRLYRQAKWVKYTRPAILAARPFCEDCHVALSVEVHHLVKRDDDPELFHDEDNLRALCRPCHSRRTRRGE